MLRWSSQSSDLNPTENCGKTFKKFILTLVFADINHVFKHIGVGPINKTKSIFIFILLTFGFGKKCFKGVKTVEKYLWYTMYNIGKYWLLDVNAISILISLSIQIFYWCSVSVQSKCENLSDILKKSGTLQHHQILPSIFAPVCSENILLLLK